MFLSLISAAVIAFAAQPDTLQSVTVVADRGLVVSRTDTLIIESTKDVGASLLMFPGIYVGDYGGVAGLKSAGLRGFSSAHTAIYVDGVRVSNVQSGQADLGFLGLQNMGSLVVDYAQNSLAFNTRRPVFRNSPVAAELKINGGSFGSWMTYGRLDFALPHNLVLSVNGLGNFSKGNYPFGDGEKRENNDLKQFQAGADIFGLVDAGDFHIKMYYNGADRGTPGSLSWPSADRQKDRNAFVQGLLRLTPGSFYSLNLSTKGSLDDLLYLSEWGNGRYTQSEFQLNSSHSFRILPWWSVSLAADASIAGLVSDYYSNTRIGTVAALATAFRTARFKADLAIEYAGTWDGRSSYWGSFSPSADIRFTIVNGLDILAFGRRAFRTPSFNELYYPGYGNPDLRPEDAWLTDIGIDFSRGVGAWKLKARLDGFHNFLTDKIISAPSADNPAIWLPYNVGKVYSYGLDALAGADFAKGLWAAGLSARYGWQKALDKTPDSYSFNEQIPYIARHTLILQGYLSWWGIKLEGVYHLNAGRRDSVDVMPDWNTLDLSLCKEFDIKRAGQIGLSLCARNLLDCRYEVVRDYPMPGRSFLGSLTYKF